MIKKIIGISLGALLLLALVVFFIVKSQLRTTHKEDVLITIPSNSNLQIVTSLLLGENVLESASLFNMLGSKMNYTDTKVKAGKYMIPVGISQIDMIRKLRIADQEPVSFTINSKRFIHDVAGELAKSIESDSATIIDTWLSKEVLKEYSSSENDLLTYILPNTYQIYWTDSPTKFLKRMKSVHDKYWNTGERQAALKKHNLTAKQIYTLASIVNAETNHVPEMATVAGLYHSRLKKGMRLESDPTAVYGAKAFDDTRIYYKVIEHKSPYNTYLNAGLPPGPIKMPSMKAIENTIFPEEHKYIFMCAKPDNSGTHNFAVTNAQHERNAAKYRRYLNSLKK